MTPHDQARAVVRKYQAEIDFNGWSDDLLEKVLAEVIHVVEQRVWEEAERLGNEQSPHHMECALKWARKCREKAELCRQQVQGRKG